MKTRNRLKKSHKKQFERQFTVAWNNASKAVDGAIRSVLLGLMCLCYAIGDSLHDAERWYANYDKRAKEKSDGKAIVQTDAGGAAA